MFSSELATVGQFFAQLYADADITHEPFSAGRQMVGHFSTPTVTAEGEWLPLADLKNVSADMSPTAGQMPRALGFAFASKIFRENVQLHDLTTLSNNGNEMCFCTIGDSSTSEGLFWETINAAGVLQVPLAVFVWDDGYGISVPVEYQTTKGSISAALKGFQKKDNTNGIDIYRVKGWDYAGLCEVFEEAIHKIRETHVPAVFHVEELTQPQGHSTSGSHERYKSSERLTWEREWDDVKKFREWIIENGIADEAELDTLRTHIRKQVKEARDAAWNNYLEPIKKESAKAVELLKSVTAGNEVTSRLIEQLAANLSCKRDLLRRDILHALASASELISNEDSKAIITNYYRQLKEENILRYDTHLYNEGSKSALRVEEVKPVFAANAKKLNGYELLNAYFDTLLSNNKKSIGFW